MYGESDQEMIDNGKETIENEEMEQEEMEQEEK